MDLPALISNAGILSGEEASESVKINGL